MDHPLDIPNERIQNHTKQMNQTIKNVDKQATAARNASEEARKMAQAAREMETATNKLLDLNKIE